MNEFSCVVIGNETLAIQCVDMLIARGHQVAAFVTRNEDLERLALERSLRSVRQGSGHTQELSDTSVDWVLSIANLEIVPDRVLALARKGAVNFHDGPLPRYAGLNAPVWAILNGETRHGITWHLIEGGLDEGDILLQQEIAIAPDETAMTLNAKCYTAALASFPALLDSLEAGGVDRRAQDLSQRSYFGRRDRPRAGGLIDFTRPSQEVTRLVRALDFGTYANPVARPKMRLGNRLFCVGAAEAVGDATVATPGIILSATEEAVDVAVQGGAVRLSRLTDLAGQSIRPGHYLQTGDVLPPLDDETASTIDAAVSAVATNEARWQDRLSRSVPASLRLTGWNSTGSTDGSGGDIALAHPDMTPPRRLAATITWALTCDGSRTGYVAFADHRVAAAAEGARGLVAPFVPLNADLAESLETVSGKIADAIEDLGRAPGFLADLPIRIPGADPQPPAIGIAEGGAKHRLPDTAVTVWFGNGRSALLFDPERVTQKVAALLAARLDHVLAVAANASPETILSDLPVLPLSERRLVLESWNQTETTYDADLTLHRAFEAQADRTPDASALLVEDRAMSYGDLDARANRVAHVLIGMGVSVGDRVGLYLRRSEDMVIAALGILKAGAAYVPLDPAYPADRIGIYVEDSGVAAIITSATLVDDLPPTRGKILVIDTDPRIGQAPATRPDVTMSPADLAYLIFTSGSTGRPKGVMIEHRNVANFFAGMDQRLEAAKGGTWLALTSLSFDISVLELFYTLARGFRVVLMGDEDRALTSKGKLPLTGKGMEFSLFYWGNDDGVGPKKYELLLEGAKIADTNGFCAVWTPERHFHAFGGPYPNPAVTGAAVAAVTRNLEIRAGSCVAPLHHPARIAEEWAVIDNMTNGRTGLAIASGWQPDDFVLRPENTPPANKPAMFESIEILRKLWRGDAVAFPTKDGTPHEVITQPRPISDELKVWVTTAGNPQSWVQAGEIGANVLTHLLGQSVAEVAEKIGLYHDALRRAGRDPADHRVTLMLHTYLAESREAARAVAKEPMKDYLRSAAALIKQYAWAFPAFKKPASARSAMDIDLQGLEPEEMEGILDFAFQRYFDESGLFGTIEDGLARVEELKRIGVDEIACLIDYGIPTGKVLEALGPLSQLRKLANLIQEIDAEDHSIAAQILRHGVTHMQCTPSMARMIVMNDEARQTLSRVRHLMLGGEALPDTLVRDLRAATSAQIENMYGPTETTIWSSTESVGNENGIQNIGRPIANTAFYVLDDSGRPVPVGCPGELYIGGAGVARGYWQRDDLTAERFLPDPFAGGEARMYRTGDLVAWRVDGRLEFIGRADHQMKIRGHRIELGEIEAVVAAQSGIRDCAVVAREDMPGDTRLVAYVTTTGPLDTDAVRNAVREILPGFMVPSHVVRLDAFPLTPNHKIDRKALPVPSAAETDAESEDPATGMSPTDDVQSALATIWARILGVRNIGAKSNFFDLGGHSLLAVQAHRDIRSELGAQALSITDIFRFPTLEGLAGHIRAATDRTPAPAKRMADPEDREQSRSDAMARRRAMRTRRSQANA